MKLDFKDKKITLMGLGLMGGGVADALFFIKEGAELTITDLRDEKELKPSIEKIKKYLNKIEPKNKPVVHWVLGRHRKEDFTQADLIIKNPGVPNNSPYLEAARNAGVKIDMASGIFLELADRGKLIAVTGTKGKSTTTALVYEILKLKYPKAYMAGLPGMPLMERVEEAKKYWGVIELSSWQLEGINKHKKSPYIAVLTNIARDHLNRHKNFEEYKDAKKIIYLYQNRTDYLVAHKSLKEETKSAPSQKIYYAQAKLENTSTILHPQNIAAAIEVAKLLNIDKAKAIKAIKQYKGLEGRLEYVGDIGEVKTYNDTTATNPYATIESLKYFKDKKIALILGGKDKGLDYSELAKALKGIHFVALLPGSASDKIKNESMERGTWDKSFQLVKSLKKAVKTCLESKPDIILLSPAAASFNMFKNEFERGKEFKKIIQIQ
ncbi:MAG: UDP-N-acetylmuramoyl-L-alanine--D-glutamate ligase [Candidatus Spechtbacterales bacterium]|nr:UDP-N-acetylmuramoyl-L-alanine--D-glutamate ligase [Candidatus Spechtbacterales bacterium]